MALLTYRSTEAGGGAAARQTSTWRRDDDGWVLVFRQATPIAGG